MKAKFIYILKGEIIMAFIKINKKMVALGAAGLALALFTKVVDDKQQSETIKEEVKAELDRRQNEENDA